MVGQAEPPRLMQESAHEAAAVGVPEESLHLGREGVDTCQNSLIADSERHFDGSNLDRC